jgi:cell wall-associated NlpC family hydrolase
MMMPELDKRLHAFRVDLADARLRGLVNAKSYVAGTPMEVVAPIAAMRIEPKFAAMQITQGLFGEKIVAFEEQNEWIWCQLERDGYVGYISRAGVSNEVTNPTHRIAVPSSYMYPQPDIKSQPAVALPMNARLEIVETDEKFSKLPNGNYVFTRHIKPLREAETDFVSVAEMFHHVPYCWGGKTAAGLDCSGLVQTSLEACGLFSPRDTDMQENQLGQNLLINDLDGLRRGDLVFWKGHVGIMTDQKTLLHANGYHMMTVKEPLVEAVSRIASTDGQVTSIKRF